MRSVLLLCVSNWRWKVNVTMALAASKLLMENWVPATHHSFPIHFPPTKSTEESVSDFNLKKSIWVSCGISWVLSSSSSVTLNAHGVLSFFLPATWLALLTKRSPRYSPFPCPFLHFKQICLTTSIPLNSTITTSDYGAKPHEACESIAQDVDRLFRCSLLFSTGQERVIIKSRLSSARDGCWLTPRWLFVMCPCMGVSTQSLWFSLELWKHLQHLATSKQRRLASPHN